MALVFLLLLNSLWTLTSGDTEVSCGFMKSCILPCSFQPGNEVVIHWIQLTTGEPPVHSYYHNQDQLAYQNPHFTGRTSLFKDQVSAGNASLQLMGVNVQDEARYKCYTSTVTGNKELFIILRVNAPVSKINLEQEGNTIICSSDGIYPEPKLTWSVDPSPTPTVRRSEQQLFSINSSLIVVRDSDYSCTITTKLSTRKATLVKPTSVSGTITATATIRCADSPAEPQIIIWTFNHSQVIVNHSGPRHTVSEGWRPYVRDMTSTGSLTLQGLSLDQTGVYTCELSDAEEKLVTNTFLQLTEGSSNSAGIVTAVIVVVLIIVGVVGAVFYQRKVKRRKGSSANSSSKKEDTGTTDETEKLNGTGETILHTEN